MAEHSPTPWRVDADMSDASPIGAWWIASTAPTYYVGAVRKEADAALIVEAVNERDRLRDLVRRLAESLECAAGALWLANITQRVAITQPEPPRRYLHGVDIDALIREAREALGEGEP